MFEYGSSRIPLFLFPSVLYYRSKIYTYDCDNLFPFYDRRDLVYDLVLIHSVAMLLNTYFTV